MRAYVGVGSNLGDRWAHLALAGRRLRAAPRVALVRASRVYDTEPVGPPQPRYLNAVLELETSLPPLAFFGLLRSIEQAAGRRREVRWGARTLDLDLLLHGDAVMSGERLVLPHPGIANRRFVLAPLAELCPDRTISGAGATVERLLASAPPLHLRRVGLFPL